MQCQYVVLLCAAVAFAAYVDGTLVMSRGNRVKRQTDKAEPKIVLLHALSTVKSRFATTILTAQLKNEANSSQEAVFTATLPDGAFISNFTMQIGDKFIVGEVKEKAKAKQDYDAAVARGESAGHVAQQARATNVFDISVNVGSQESVTFELTYQEVLQRVHDVYKHMINIATKQVIDDLRVHVSLAERLKITKVHVPEVAKKQGEKNNKDLLLLPAAKNVPIEQTDTADGSFVEIDYSPTAVEQKANIAGDGVTQMVVLYDVERTEDGGELLVVDGYFVHFFAPRSLPAVPKRIVFVIDISGSMAGVKLEQTKQAMSVILRDLNANDQFNILIFDDEVEQWRAEFQPMSKVDEAITFVNQLRDDGGTNINQAVLDAMAKFTGGAKTGDTVIFMTDGQATSGITDRDIILSNIKRSLDRQRVTVHTIAFGTGADYNLLKSIAIAANGLARKVYEDSDAALQMAGFYAQVGNPLLSDVKIKYVNASVEPDSLVQDVQYNFYEGTEIVTVGKLSSTQSVSPAARPSAVIEANSASGARSLRCIALDDIVPRHVPYCPCCPACPQDAICVPCYMPFWHCQPRITDDCHWPHPIPTTTEAPVASAKSVGGFIERMWAKRSIDKMLETATYGGVSSEEQSRLKDRALKLSLKYNFVTELTSMVVVQNNKTSAIDEKPGLRETPAHATNSLSAPTAFMTGSRGPASAAGGATADAFAPLMGQPRPTFMPPPPQPTSTTVKPSSDQCRGHNATLLTVDGSELHCSNQDKCPYGYECTQGACCSQSVLFARGEVHACAAPHTYWSPCNNYVYSCAEVSALGVANVRLDLDPSNRQCNFIAGCVCQPGYARNAQGDCVPLAQC